jgi:protein gp37
MGDKSAIQWTDATWNPVTGCSKVSPGCAHCYAEDLTMRFASTWGVLGLPWTPENAAENVVLHPDRLDQPLRWRRPRMVFVNSMSDLFHEQVPDDYVHQVMQVIERCPQHTFQVLTKRPERMRDLMRWLYQCEWCGGTGFRRPDDAHRRRDCEMCDGDGRKKPLSNLWLGVSIENRRYVHRADLLRETPAAVRFISAEPLLGPLIPESITVADTGETTWGWGDDYSGPGLRFYGEDGRLAFDWLIAGGESGPEHRRMDAQWVRDLRDVCTHEGVEFFFKQWGGRTPKAGGRELDGRTWDEMPQQRVAVSV